MYEAFLSTDDCYRINLSETTLHD